jgi:hypothetical protein
VFDLRGIVVGTLGGLSGMGVVGGADVPDRDACAARASDSRIEVFYDPSKPAVLRRIARETLAEMIDTTRSRVNFFMNEFKTLWFIEYNGGLKVNHSLLTVIVHD